MQFRGVLYVGLRFFGPVLPGEDAVEVFHVLHDSFGCMFVPGFNLQEPQASECDDTGEKMTPDLVVGPMEHWIDLNMAAGLAHSKLLLDSTSIKAGAHNLFGGPAAIVGDNDIFPHHGLDSVNLRCVFSKTHGRFVESKLIPFAADVELITELAVTGDNRLGTLPVAFLMVVFSAILH